MEIKCLYDVEPLVARKSYAMIRPGTNDVVLYEHLRNLPEPIKKVIVAHEEVHIKVPFIFHKKFGDIDHMIIETIASLSSENPMDYVQMSRVFYEELMKWCREKYRKDFG